MRPARSQGLTMFGVLWITKGRARAGVFPTLGLGPWFSLRAVFPTGAWLLLQGTHVHHPENQMWPRTSWRGHTPQSHWYQTPWPCGRASMPTHGEQQSSWTGQQQHPSSSHGAPHGPREAGTHEMSTNPQTRGGQSPPLVASHSTPLFPCRWIPQPTRPRIRPPWADFWKLPGTGVSQPGPLPQVPSQRLRGPWRLPWLSALSQLLALPLPLHSSPHLREEQHTTPGRAKSPDPGPGNLSAWHPGMILIVICKVSLRAPGARRALGRLLGWGGP